MTLINCLLGSVNHYLTLCSLRFSRAADGPDGGCGKLLTYGWPEIL